MKKVFKELHFSKGLFISDFLNKGDFLLPLMEGNKKIDLSAKIYMELVRPNIPCVQDLMFVSVSSHGSLKLRNEIGEDVFSTLNGKTIHGMIVTKFSFSLTKQVLEAWLSQVSYGDHKPLLLVLSNIDCTMSLGNC